MNSRRKVLRSLAAASLSLPWLSAMAGTQLKLPAENDPNYWDKIRDAFMLSKEKVFFNTGTVGAMPKIVVQRVFEHFEKLATDVADWDYKSDIGWIGGYHPLPDLRKKIAQLIHADAASIALTDNVTSAMSYIAMGLNLKPGDEVLASNQEHGGGRSSWIVRSKREGILYREVVLPKPIRNNDEVLSIIRKAIRPETRVLMLSHIITGSGAILPVREICAEARAKGILTVLDGAQTIGQIKVDIAEIGCDAYVGCFHKWIGAPPGTGFMWVRPDVLKTLWTSVSSYQWDNHEDEGFRFTQRGTGNFSILAGLDAALDFHAEIGPQRVYDRIKYLGQYLRDGLRKLPKVKIYSPVDEKMCAGITVYNVAGRTGAQLQDAFWNLARMRPRSQGDEFGVRHCTHIYNSQKELDKALEIVKSLAA
ncbi:MAG: aminotransferase class V-fold PLP-dependent enzyme [Cyclobacteriaceae bacterium]|nr:aminotransferase class V-fold PLP-dependent enzyme [Cyclobacteriaceae bacterium]MCX7637035.1 aminotransferase class V-fold PLP-dependent enzyme [Cyclobacteriaceae bacterium]MDW8331159.1 aminotransferase class V-fold PLP-dependent enzyme [Cyclobacteriaceae bacterium]